MLIEDSNKHMYFENRREENQLLKEFLTHLQQVTMNSLKQLKRKKKSQSILKRVSQKSKEGLILQSEEITLGFKTSK